MLKSSLNDPRKTGPAGGGGIYNYGGTLTLTNSSVTKNTHRSFDNDVYTECSSQRGKSAPLNSLIQLKNLLKAALHLEGDEALAKYLAASNYTED